jgi:hypothetical protein
MEIESFESVPFKNPRSHNPSLATETASSLAARQLAGSQHSDKEPFENTAPNCKSFFVNTLLSSET